MSVNEQAIIRVLTGQRSHLLAYIASIVRDPQIVEDVYQDVCLLALERRGEVYNEQSIMPWLRAVGQNKSLTALRRQRKQPAPMDQSLLDLMEEQWREEDASRDGPAMEALRYCLEKLTPYARRIVDLRYGDGLATRKVAETLNRNVETVYKALTRAHSTLGECIKRRQIKEGGALG